MNHNFSFETKNNFISVIIPVYKDPEGLEITLKSLFNQDFDNNRYEIIVANDGGDKETEKICLNYNIYPINIVPNQGSYHARNMALTKSRGEFIAFVDADIFVPNDWLGRGFDLLQKNDYIGGNVIIDKDKLSKLAHYYEYLASFNTKIKLKNYNYAPTANLFVKREVLVKIGFFDDRLWSGGDVEFGNRVGDAEIFNMTYDSELFVIHPPRNQKALIKKYKRTNEGALNLVKLYPQRFSHLKNNYLKYIKTLFIPFYKVLSTKKDLTLLIKLKLLFWSMCFGFTNFINLLRISRQVKK